MHILKTQEMHWVWINSWRLRVGLSRYCHSIFQCTESETTVYKSHCFITSFLSFHIFYAVTFCSSVLVNTTVSKCFTWWSRVLSKINAFKSNNWMPVLPCYWSLLTWHVLLYKTWWHSSSVNAAWMNGVCCIKNSYYRLFYFEYDLLPDFSPPFPPSFLSLFRFQLLLIKLECKMLEQILVILMMMKEVAWLVIPPFSLFYFYFL